MSGPSDLAFASLTPSQIAFLQGLPKAELHAHLNGCIPLSTLQSLTQASASNSTDPLVQSGLALLKKGVDLNVLDDFFTLFPAIYAITSTPTAIRTAALAVLHSFLEPGPEGSAPQCTYLELRTTPRESAHMSREDYLRSVLLEVEKYPRSKAGLIVSLDRRMDPAVARECVDIAIKLKEEGKAVVGVDLCGAPLAGEMQAFKPIFMSAKHAGLGITLHIAETIDNTNDETLEFLSWGPNRLGHATFLSIEACEVVARESMAIEICLSSNLLCKTVPTLTSHHLHHWLARGHPLVICSDDTLPFRTTLLAEYALLLARAPLGLGFSEEEVAKIANKGLQCRFSS